MEFQVDSILAKQVKERRETDHNEPGLGTHTHAHNQTQTLVYCIITLCDIRHCLLREIDSVKT